ncbi:putative alpha-glucuronidase A [Mycena albidolilacea]|uniref:Alpha-glucuronidase n=1 Tax=Mycena albidolilacea TaxID=1033008 RepID=A0AAD6ZV26_9AGAR|nr:putative alpha-glucuronidase A [Mycena albidolilacea]
MMLKLFHYFLFTGLVAAENGRQAWLRYAPLPQGHNTPLPSSIIALNSSTNSPVNTAGQELQKGIQGIFGKHLSVRNTGKETSSAVVGTVSQFQKAFGTSPVKDKLEEDGFWLNVKGTTVQILGQTERGALYGAFEYLSMLAQGNFSNVEYAMNPAAPVRWINSWDNMDGSITRGFGGNSIFFTDGHVISDLTRASEYARLLSSIRINAVVVNDVNANFATINPANIQGVGRIADVFRPYGIQLGLSLDFASPMELGNLSTYDPLDPGVIAFWDDITKQIYHRIPDFAGYLVKADSEGTPGPLVYNRTLADGANLFAKAIKPFGGIVMYRAFVYNQLPDEGDWKADRANAAVNFFQPLDGQFDDNVIVQIKYGPIDFQVREPASPLFANLLETNTAIELQVAQEYLGQQCHLVYLPPLWRTILDFDLRVQNQSSLVRNVITGERFKRPLGGSAAVVNVGLNDTWLGSHLSMSNLYAYGRLAWDWTSDSEEILQDWTRLTFGLDNTVVDTITQMSMASWPAYENYSGNLGEQTLNDILYTHFGPNPQTLDNTPWGQWTRADHASIGMDRTVSNGTGFSGQYPPEVAAMYENIETTPDNLLLWFHHVNYTQKLKSGKTVIQHFYDAHYEGAETAQNFVTMWQSLKGKIDDERLEDVLFRQVFQAGHSIVWRDAIVNFYNKISGIPDDAGRVGHHPFRIEAESMELSGYQPYVVSPFETASNSIAIVTSTNNTIGTATKVLNFTSGVYDLAVNYFDMYGGNSSYQVFVNNRLVGEWVGNIMDIGKLGHTPSIYLDGHSATRITFHQVPIKKGDILKIVGQANGVEPAPLDYVALLPAGMID